MEERGEQEMEQRKQMAAAARGLPEIFPSAVICCGD